MPLITDPDNLSQGFNTTVTDGVWGSSSGVTTTITSAGAGLPSIAAGQYFEVRNHSNPANNGLYKESGGSPTTSSVTADKVTGSNPANAASESVNVLHKNDTAANRKSVMIDTGAKRILLLEQGNLDAAGVTTQALYSFLKEEWKDDADLIAHTFPMVSITPEQFEFQSDWEPRDVTSPAIRTRKLLRTGGWREISAAAIVKKEYAGIITLGNFEDNVNDRAYYQVGSDPTDTAAATDFTFAGPVNEAILTYEETGTPSGGVAFTTSTITRTVGSWITDGYKKGAQITIRAAEDAGNNITVEIASLTATVLTVVGTPLTANAADTTAIFSRNYRNRVKVFLRIRDADPNGKTFAQAALSDIGVTAVDNKVFRFPLSNATDLKISATDATITGSSPYTQIAVRHFDQAFTIDVDTPGTGRNFGIVIGVGTHPGVDGSFSSGGSVLTTSEGGITGADFAGGSLIVTEGAAKGTYAISGTPTGTTVTITTTFPAAGSNVAFYLQRSSPVVATAEQIYEKIQYLLRQAADVDATDQVVTGKTADALLRFVGDTLEAGQAIPSNPNGGGSGVFIAGFSSNDTNRLTFYDNTGAARTFPFVAAGTINFNDNLVADGDGKYWMFFDYTKRKVVADLALSGASGSAASFDSAGANLPSGLAQNDYVRLSGMTNAANNGIWRVTDAAPTTSQFDAVKVDGQAVVNESAASRTVDEHPYGSPGAIIVDNNADLDIAGTIGGAQAAFDFDYDGNNQGGRTAGTNAAIVIVAIGLDTAQFVSTTGTITRATGLSFSLVAALERNYNS